MMTIAIGSFGMSLPITLDLPDPRSPIPDPVSPSLFDLHTSQTKRVDSVFPNLGHLRHQPLDHSILHSRCDTNVQDEWIGGE